MRRPTLPQVAMLDALAECLESGVALADALGAVAAAGSAAAVWALPIRRSLPLDSAVTNVPVALRAAGALDDDEVVMLGGPSSGQASALPDGLHAVSTRRRRGIARRSMLGWALASPVTMLALGVVLNPLPNLIEGGPFVSPVLAGLFALFGATLALVVGVPALLRRAGTRARALRFCSAIPLGRWFAAQYAEEELLTILAPFVRDGEVSAAGFEAAAALLSWSRLGEPLREAARSPHTPSEALSLGGLAPLAPHLSLPTSLSVIGGAASKRLAQRMSERSDAVATLLTSRMRMAVRVVAYTLVVAFSVGSLVGLASRGLPEIPGLGGQGGQDEKELQELLKQLQ